MPDAITQRPHFKDRLRQDLSLQGMSIAELGRRVNPKDPQAGRRHVHKLLAGKHLPTRATRIRLALALGFEPTHYDDEDEEEDRLRSVAFALVDTLITELRRGVEA